MNGSSSSSSSPSSSSSSSSAGPSLFVDFEFDMSVVDGMYTKGVRPTSIVYPSGRHLRYDYGASGGDGDKLSRIGTIKDDDNAPLAAYDYLGANRIVIENYAQPQVKLDYTTSACAPSSSSSSAGTKYPGFDRFDRVVQHQWCRYGTSPGIVDRFDYSYDRSSNPVTKKSYACPNTSELRTYDGLSRLKTYKRGALSGGTIPSPIRQEDFSLDSTANWKCYDVTESGTPSLIQTQTHNVLNEITAINETTGPAWFEPDYDGNGNMIHCPQPAAMGSGFDLKFDAWNRLVQVNSAGSSLVATYQYDGMDRRIVKFVHAAGTYEHFYYSDASLPVETRKGTSSSTIPGSYEQQYLQGLSGHVILYDRNLFQSFTLLGSSSSSSSSTPAQPSRLFLTTDAWGATASLLTSSGPCVERYTYNAHGQLVILNDSCSVTGATTSAYGNYSLWPGFVFDAESLLYNDSSTIYHAQLGERIACPFLWHARFGGRFFGRFRRCPRPRRFFPGWGSQGGNDGPELESELPSQPEGPDLPPRATEPDLPPRAPEPSPDPYEGLDEEKRFWTRDDWDEYRKEGNFPPGHNPEHHPPDYRWLPKGTTAEPIRWGEELGGPEAMPRPEDIEDWKGDCKCILPTEYGSTMRPRGMYGTYPTPGKSDVRCKLNAQITMRYQARCVKQTYSAADRRVGECDQLVCHAYVLWKCIAPPRHPERTYWGRDQSFLFTKCRKPFQ